MKVLEQLCVKSLEVSDGVETFVIQQGKTYTTSEPSEGGLVTVFSLRWVRGVPQEHFVPVEAKPPHRLR